MPCCHFQRAEERFDRDLLAEKLEEILIKGLNTSIDKGHFAQFKLLTYRLQNGGGALIPFADIENVTLVSFACIESLMVGG
jgi:hypothetical protein